MDSNGLEPDKSLTDQEGVLFPSTPIWERGRKRRGLGGRKAPSSAAAPEPRSSTVDDRDEEPVTLDTPVGPTAGYAEARAAEPVTVQEDEREGRVPPIRSEAREPRSGGIGTGAVVGALASVAVLGAGGWYMLRDREAVPELTPGSTVTQVATTAPLTPTAPPPEPAAVPPPAQTASAPAEPARTTVRTERRMASAARARPAASAPSAATTGIDASATATLPDAPQPYSAVNPSAAPAPVNPPVNPAPSATTQTSPAESIPATPPTAPEASPPSTTPDPTPQSATPPQ